MKKTAMTMFGISAAWPADTSLTAIDGLDDDAADVLQEIGITSAQHLATMAIPEVCGRTLYPHGRILDWIDQAILMVHTNGRIRELRAIGIHSAHSLVSIADFQQERDPLQLAAKERLDEAAKRLGISFNSLLLVVECIKSDPAYGKLKHKLCDRLAVRNGLRQTTRNRVLSPRPRLVSGSRETEALHSGHDRDHSESSR